MSEVEVDMAEENKNISVIDVSGPDESSAIGLLDGRVIAYHDPMYEVTSGAHEILMKLLQRQDEMVLFYLHVPYAYPIPDGVKIKVKDDLETTLKKTIQKIRFINAGTEAQKKDIQFRMELGGNDDGQI